MGHSLHILHFYRICNSFQHNMRFAFVDGAFVGKLPLVGSKQPVEVVDIVCKNLNYKTLQDNNN